MPGTANCAMITKRRGMRYNIDGPKMETEIMSITVVGIVKTGVVVPNAPLPEGARVEVHLNDATAPPRQRQSMLEFLATLPPGPLLFKTPEDANRYIQEE